jgi:catechol 2,3-dioxygenase-like lactoylglutathione lyase family enzyme
MTTLVVPDYDAAREFYTGLLGFTLIEDTHLSDGKRWLVVEAAGGGRLLLARAADNAQRAAIGNQAGGRVAFFLQTDSFTDCHNRFTAAGVTFDEEPRHEPYGTVAVFSDPFGNRWDLIEVKDHQ